jgi:hypothetical protein
MAVPVPSVKCSILNNYNLFYQEKSAPAFKRDKKLPSSALLIQMILSIVFIGVSELKRNSKIKLFHLKLGFL